MRTTKVLLVLIINVLDQRHPAICVVHMVTEPRRVDNGQTTAESLLLDD